MNQKSPSPSDSRQNAPRKAAGREETGDSTPPPGSESLEFLEILYEQYQRNPSLVPQQWRDWFNHAPSGDSQESFRRSPSFKRRSAFNPPPSGRQTEDSRAVVLQERVDQLIRNYRVRGHIIARVDPLEHQRIEPAELKPEFYGFSDEDLDRTFSTSWVGGPRSRTLREILQWLRNTYCRSIGVQFMHIDSLQVRQWLQDRMESTENRLTLPRETQLRILRRLIDAVVFEEFLQKKYTGAKSFSLEGAESLIPLLDLAFETAGDHGVKEIVLAMAHRGRLNVLANIVGKHPRQIFREFEDVDPELHIGRGDVKYHMGYSNDWTTGSGHNIHVSLCFNPSHLEFVNPVALGRMRAKQDRFGDIERKRGMVLLIHGDASFAGEGIVQETLNLSGLTGYSVGGTVHVVVNNQLGFTTPPSQGRSTTYATAVARMLQIPIFHVNGEEPEAVAQAVHLAMEFRRRFQRDVVIDMYCYRLRGHNEGDEPEFTQPQMYRAIKQRESVGESYERHLVDLGQVSESEVEEIAAERRAHLEAELKTARREDYIPQPEMLAGVWEGYQGGPVTEVADVDTGVDPERLKALLEKQTQLPEDFHPHRKIKRGMQRRLEMARGEKPLDWSAAESLAFASLATEGICIRMSGQDSQRGTFSQRHAVLHDVEDGRTFTPLQHLADNQAPVEIYNSPLSEAGVLGFEYGYSLDRPDSLVIWEAQFGDFANAAQVIIDQFIASAEDKWRRLSGLVLLLPHGFEGQGPEHSSARLERFLMLAAEDNMQIVYPTTPAQYFHCLRRQALRRWRKPLVVMTPKSLLRHPKSVSNLEDCAGERFQNVIPETSEELHRVSRVLLCSGKVYFDLIEERDASQRDDVAVVRIEQLYPFPEDELRSALERYHDDVSVFWVQEEPANMGAMRYLQHRWGNRVCGRLPLSYISRRESCSPATGSKTAHEIEQKKLMQRAFGGS
ncbi:MAG: 2-oxoglutarate dehydrogenase E1 component [Planctomycetota bacterium]|nr:MAG: 2-oxoglutarate dehydrogenase E1 component [Planctomycetota bacterium]REK20008.1 MAG: 2-oxoglutarate dehydrogenase E1 component [Planctomycetota bacterium]REK27575.1 MAG: 2-oxoglutarate dehydrogenase E1 component [Planctomycetota bacterium]